MSAAFYMSRPLVLKEFKLNGLHSISLTEHHLF